MIETTNPEASLAFARKVSGATATSPAPQTYNGASYQTEPDDPTNVFGTVGDFLVTGDLTGFKAAVDAQKGDSLGDDSDFKDSLDQLPGDRLGTFYTVPKTLIDSIGSAQFDQQSRALHREERRRVARQAGVRCPDGLGRQLRSRVRRRRQRRRDAGELARRRRARGFLARARYREPRRHREADAPAAQGLGIPNIEQALSQVESATGASVDQLTNALGDAVLYVRGTTQQTLNGALVVHTNDPELTGRLLSQLQTLVQLGGQGTAKPLQLGGGGTGFQINDPTQAPQPIEIAQQGDKLVIGYGANSAAQSLAPSQPLSGSPTFSAAKGQVSDLGTDFFLDLPTVFRLAESRARSPTPTTSRRSRTSTPSATSSPGRARRATRPS